MIVTLVRSLEDRRTVDMHARDRSERVKHCETHDDLCECAMNGVVRTIVADLDAWPEGGTHEVARRLMNRTDPVALHAIHDLSPRAISELRLFARFDLDVRPAYRRYHALEDRLRDLTATGLRCATMAILRRLADSLGDDVADLIVCCVVLAERKATEQRVAAALGISVRRLRARLVAAGLPTFCRLTAMIRVAHALYRMSALGVSPTSAGQGAGLSGARSLETFMRRHTKRTPRQLLAAGGFDLYAAEIDAWFSKRRKPRGRGAPRGPVASNNATRKAAG